MSLRRLNVGDDGDESGLEDGPATGGDVATGAMVRWMGDEEKDRNSPNGNLADETARLNAQALVDNWTHANLCCSQSHRDIYNLSNNSSPTI